MYISFSLKSWRCHLLFGTLTISPPINLYSLSFPTDFLLDFSWKSFSHQVKSWCVCVHVHAHSVAKSCPTLCNPMDCSPPGSSVCGIFQERITGLGRKKENTGVGCHLLLQGIFLTQWSLYPSDPLVSPALADEFFIPPATWEAPKTSSTYP